MTEEEFEQSLLELLNGVANGDFDEDAVPSELVDPDSGVASVRTLREAGTLTKDAGLVLRTKDGREFQLTLVRSR